MLILCGDLTNFGKVAEAEMLAEDLRACAISIVGVLHYAPVPDTVAGEPAEIYPFLGSSRLADAVDRFGNVKLVVHGHAHRGTYEGRTRRGIPVFNCAQQVVARKFDRPYALLEV